ncbi:MAG: pyruvate, phosphate dikinase, partial [Candidatus Omnitrophica bacterium]|nr:pyruvate, phosphate dikinase [Candidatus Omnitrophota bacterium]
EQIWANLTKLEKATGKTFGKGPRPLLVSVRSGAKFSMPGMMDTILNLGLNDSTVEALAAQSKNERFAYDSYRRFIQMYSDVVLEIDHDHFEKMLSALKKERGARIDTDLKVDDLKELVKRYKEVVKRDSGKAFPQDPREQLKLAVNAVFNSWQNERANKYRNLNKIDHNIGTAVNVQSMVFGNLSETSGTGVAFTRDPGSGKKLFFGEYLLNAQGEDVVAGIRTPSAIADLKKARPSLYKKLETIYKKLEKHYRDMQDIEFTFENEDLYLLQTRNGKRTALAAVNIAVDMVKEKLISKREAVARIEPAQLDQLLHPMIDPKAKVDVAAKGLPASPGAAVGQVVFNSEDAEEWTQTKGVDVILVRQETSPEDVGGMAVSKGILTATGGMTSHAAVVARGMGKCCIAGCSAITIDEEARTFKVGPHTVKEGDIVTLNGTTGEVILGKTALVEPVVAGAFNQIMKWADEIRTLTVRTNADTPQDAEAARGFGAQGIGLCRTEHMFFGEERLRSVREMIFADDEAARRAALAKLKPYQKSDFLGIFEAMAGLPVTVRLLDPPLHEFLPKGAEEVARVAADLGIPEKKLHEKTEALHEFNPMLGHRGCRLAVTYPEIYEMQVEAIVEAACELAARKVKVYPEIMIPLVGMTTELELLANDLRGVADRIIRERRSKLVYMMGTMIEVPRAAVVAGDLAQIAQFFSFGTNDLTQMTLGFSRDDVAKFLPHYIQKGVLKDDPFATLDQQGVGALVQMAVKSARSVNPKIKLGICGEHGGDPRSIEFCHRMGLNYVSCSPFRVPIARLSAAQAVIENSKK